MTRLTLSLLDNAWLRLSPPQSRMSGRKGIPAKTPELHHCSKDGKPTHTTQPQPHHMSTLRLHHSYAIIRVYSYSILRDAARNRNAREQTPNWRSIGQKQTQRKRQKLGTQSTEWTVPDTGQCGNAGTAYMHALGLTAQRPPQGN